MSRIAVVLLIGMACLGCASRPKAYWHHPDKTLEEARADCKACTRQAHAHAQKEHVWRYQESSERGRPWQMGNELTEEANRELDEENFFRSCMAAKGYRQQHEFPLDAKIRRGEYFSEHFAGR
jgi:hypothetical protein